ncbi:MAG TPA: DUF1993 domain-containing protein [Caulobacteraceae bacterium]|nr:DUF1993 domain-containing protein [Caulobacteraceae bacterium]
MAISLYEATVERYLQTLGAVAGVLDKGAAHCAETGTDPSDLVATRLCSDMLPLAFQVWSVEHHSNGAIEGAKSGVFAPPGPLPALTYADLQKIVADTREKVGALTPDEVNGLQGRDMVFQIGERKMPFTAEGFLLSFSLPNFFFHATTTYDILRSKGVKLGKRDFMGALRLKA